MKEVVMKKAFLALVALSVCAYWQGIGFCEIKKVSIPNVEMAPSLTSVMNQKNSILQKETAPVSIEAPSSVQTNGYVLDGGNVIVDSLVEPKCVFYGNYNEGSGDAFQSINVDTIILECL